MAVCRRVRTEHQQQLESTEEGSTECDPAPAEAVIDRINEEITYEEFFVKYLLANKPCVFAAHITKDWGCRKNWVSADDDDKPYWSFLKTTFGDAVVPIAHCDKEEFNSHPKSDKSMKDYLDYWMKYVESDYSNQLPCDYLKDWHCMRSFPDCDIYTTPIYFTSDWLNEYCNHLNIDDYRFVYMGPKGSWTPFHADVMRSYSWSANICGRKRWILYAPGQEDLLKNKLGQLPFDVTSDDLKDKSIYPNVDKVTSRYEIIQNSGEIIFVPSGWHHQVFNEEDTISLNHNWFNGCNVETCWKYIKSCLKDVQNEIEDCRVTMEASEWVKQCQLILKASSGVNYVDFFRYLLIILENRRGLVQNCVDLGQSELCLLHNEPQCAVYHWQFDLSKIQVILEDMLNDEDFMNIDVTNFSVQPETVLKDLKSVLSLCMDDT
ncbi:2-oxoglutarate and iron-dependent oxygenase JMJD4-like [Tubulanus polymorphus]|uniref:2-oxoglutarate and iron-dependent oxygenase JMJD4-like n=1 Tax=Tubulanus polymorphus TaxID=672921 RepID=UPI003DA2647B